MNLFLQTLKQLQEKAHLHTPCLDHQTGSLEEHSRILILRHSPQIFLLLLLSVLWCYSSWKLNWTSCPSREARKKSDTNGIRDALWQDLGCVLCMASHLFSMTVLWATYYYHLYSIVQLSKVRERESWKKLSHITRLVKNIWSLKLRPETLSSTYISLLTHSCLSLKPERRLPNNGSWSKAYFCPVKPDGCLKQQV